MLDEHKITIELKPEARSLLAEKGYDPAFGARPLKRAIQKMLQDPLAEKLLSGEIKDGTALRVGAASDRLIFETAGKSAVGRAA